MLSLISSSRIARCPPHHDHVNPIYPTLPRSTTPSSFPFLSLPSPSCTPLCTIPIGPDEQGLSPSYIHRAGLRLRLYNGHPGAHSNPSPRFVFPYHTLPDYYSSAQAQSTIMSLIQTLALTPITGPALAKLQTVPKIERSFSASSIFSNGSTSSTYSRAADDMVDRLAAQAVSLVLLLRCPVSCMLSVPSSLWSELLPAKPLFPLSPRISSFPTHILHSHSHRLFPLATLNHAR